jgi:signal transduction histidine kinase
MQLWKRVLLLILLTLTLAPCSDAIPAGPAAPPAVRDSVRLDSIRQLVVFYEQQGDYEEAYRQGLVYTAERLSQQQQTLSELATRYRRQFDDQQLENDRVGLLKQHALMELDQAEKDVALLHLRRTQDSICLVNQQLDRLNRLTANQIALKQMRQHDEQQRRLIEEENLHDTVLGAFVVAILIISVLLVIYLRSNLLAFRRLQLEKHRAEETRAEAEADNHAQNRFLLNLNQQIRQPVDEIIRNAQILGQEAEGKSSTSSSPGNSDPETLSPENSDSESAAKAEAVERMRTQIHQLLTEVDDIIRKSVGSTGEQLMKVLILGVALSLGAAPRTHAQDNPYGIRDDFYQYFKRADLMIQSDVVPAMADTLYERARRAGDGVTMCLALDLHVGHAYFTYDPEKVKAAHQRQAACALATGNYKYVFVGWNRLILTYINRRDFVNATNETRHYQEEAVRLNNAYGISRGYYYMGDIFKARGMLREATEQYRLAVDYLKQQTDRTDISSAYARLGEACIENGDYAQAERYLLQGVANARMEYEKINPNLGLFDLYVTQGDTVKARGVIAELERIKRNGMLMGNRNISYLNSMVKYWLLTGHNDKALFYLDSIGNKHPRTKYMTYAAVGNYREAVKYLYEFNIAGKADDARMDAARLAALKADYENHLKERDNNELALRNARLRTEQLMAEQALDAEQHRQDSLLMSNNDLQEDAQESNLILQRSEEAIRQEALKRDQVYLDYRRKTLGVMLVLVVGVALLLVLKLISRRRNARQWQQQKMEAEEATRLAKEAGLRKQNFLEQITHELRTPLNAVLGFSEVLCDETMCRECPPEELADFRQRVNEGAESLRALVDSSLELCAIEAGQLTPQLSRCRLHDVLTPLVRQYTAKAKSGVSLRLREEGRKTEITTDAALLTRALSMLLDNACKFTEHGQIVVACSAQKGQTEITVTDTGCGIPPEKADDIFHHFEKVDSFIPGIGLGLSLCRSIITLLRGEVYLDTDYKEGSRFVVRWKEN